MVHYFINRRSIFKHLFKNTVCVLKYTPLSIRMQPQCWQWIVWLSNESYPREAQLDWDLGWSWGQVKALGCWLWTFWLFLNHVCGVTWLFSWLRIEDVICCKPGEHSVVPTDHCYFNCTFCWLLHHDRRKFSVLLHRESYYWDPGSNILHQTVGFFGVNFDWLKNKGVGKISWLVL